MTAVNRTSATRTRFEIVHRNRFDNFSALFALDCISNNRHIGLLSNYAQSSLSHFLRQFIPCYRLQIPFRIALHDQLNIGSRIIIDQVIQFRSLIHILRLDLLHLRSINRKDVTILQPGIHAAGVHIVIASVHFHCLFPLLCNYHPVLLPSSLIAKQNLSHAFPVINNGSPSRILSVLLISLGITTLPSSSMRRTMPVAFITGSTPSMLRCFHSIYCGAISRIYTRNGRLDTFMQRWQIFLSFKSSYLYFPAALCYNHFRFPKFLAAKENHHEYCQMGRRMGLCAFVYRA